MRKAKNKDNTKQILSDTITYPLQTMPPEDMFISQATLDFHKLGSLMHHEISQLVNEFIENSFHQGFYRIKIITGKGAVVRPMTQKILKKSTFVKDFRFAGYFTGQNGAIEILLKDRISL